MLLNTALDKLFAPTSGHSVQKSEPVPAPSPVSVGTSSFRDLPIDSLVDMEQPFHTYYDTPKMESLRHSIIQNGIIQRIVVRPLEEGKFQIISGRHRRTGAQLAGYTVVPCEIRELTDDQALVLMIEANLQQREGLLPSEKAYAYRERLEALKRQGRRTDLTSCQHGTKSRSDEELASEVPDSARHIHRYIRLTSLVENLLSDVDSGHLSVSAGNILADLSTADQDVVHNFFFTSHRLPITEQLAKRIVGASDPRRPLNTEKLLELTSAPPKPVRQISVPMKSINKYLPQGMPTAQVKKLIVEAIKEYCEAHQEVN